MDVKVILIQKNNEYHTENKPDRAINHLGVGASYMKNFIRIGNEYDKHIGNLLR